MTSAFEGIVGDLLGKLGGAKGLESVVGKVGPALTAMLSGGGLGKLVSQFQNAGLGKQADSWVGTGENEPITADHVKQALSEEQIGKVAEQLGVSNDQAAAALAETLPEAVNQLTPTGSLPEPADVDRALQAVPAS